MAITAIGRYFVGDPNIVAIVTTDTLATITTTGYVTTQQDEIEALQNGEFQWTDTDLVLMHYSPNLIGFFTYDADNATFDELDPTGGLSNSLQDGDIFVGNGANVATGVTPSGDITLSNTGVFGIAAGAIVNADVNAAAAIAFSKLATLASANILVGSAGGVATSVAMTGDIAITNTGVTSIAAGAIINADINAAAAIAFSKLATLPSAEILVGSAGGVATAVAMTGDVTISNTGVTSIAALSIVNADISASAAIDFSKLAALPSAQVLVGSAGNVATAVAVTGDVTISNAGVTAIAADSIVNADVNSAAAIAFSKLATLASGNILVGSAGGVATSVTMSGDVAIIASGATTIQAGAVDLAMLSAGITPAAVIKFFDQVTTVGGAAAEAFSVPGALAASDRAFVQVVNDGGSNVTVLQAVVTNDTLTVTFSGNPGNDTVINYQLIRAAA